jgi:hypothetical protein
MSLRPLCFSQHDSTVYYRYLAPPRTVTLEASPHSQRVVAVRDYNAQPSTLLYSACVISVLPLFYAFSQVYAIYDIRSFLTCYTSHSFLVVFCCIQCTHRASIACYQIATPCATSATTLLALFKYMNALSLCPVSRRIVYSVSAAPRRKACNNDTNEYTSKVNQVGS